MRSITLPTEHDLRQAIEEDPFGSTAINHARSRRFSALAQEAEVVPLLDDLCRDGAVVVRSLLSPDLLSEIRSEIDRLRDDTPRGSNSFGGYETRRAFNLLSRTRVLDDLVLEPTVLALVEGLLDDQVQLSIASTISLEAGETCQPLHRDDSYYPIRRPHQALCVNVMWALDDFTETNGATRYVPESHLWDDSMEPPEEEIRVAAMPAGSAFVWHGSLLHGGGANTTTSPRAGLSMLYCRAWLRQQENQYLGLDPQVVATFERPLQRLLGFSMYGATLGNVDGADPKHWLANHNNAR